MAKKQIRDIQRLTSPAHRRWLDALVFELNDVRLSRSEVAALTESPSTRAAMVLDNVCRRMHITTTYKLFTIGLDGLLRCKGIGERSAWIAAHVLQLEEYDVELWASRDRKPRQLREAIRLVHSKTRKARHA